MSQVHEGKEIDLASAGKEKRHGRKGNTGTQLLVLAGMVH